MMQQYKSLGNCNFFPKRIKDGVSLNERRRLSVGYTPSYRGEGAVLKGWRAAIVGTNCRSRRGTGGREN